MNTTISDIMEIISPDTDFLFADLVDGRVSMYCYISNNCDSWLTEAIQAWADDTDDVGIKLTFQLGSVLDTAIDQHQIPNSGNAIDSDAKPLFDAMRAELVQMVERIDSLKYIDCQHGAA